MLHMICVNRLNFNSIICSIKNETFSEGTPAGGSQHTSLSNITIDSDLSNAQADFQIDVDTVALSANQNTLPHQPMND